MTAIPDRSGLLVVDVEEGFLNDATAPVAKDIARLLDEQLDRFELCVASRFVNREDGPCSRLLGFREVAGPPETSLAEGIERPGVVVVEKCAYALGKPLSDLLAEHGIETLFLVGVDTHACVLHEALDAFDRGVRPIVLADFCASGDGAEAHECALTVMRQAVGIHNVWSGTRLTHPPG